MSYTMYMISIFCDMSWYCGNRNYSAILATLQDSENGRVVTIGYCGVSYCTLTKV